MLLGVSRKRMPMEPRVTWPSKSEVYATTVVVILTSLVFGLYLFGIDLLLNAAVQRIFQRFGGA